MLDGLMDHDEHHAGPDQQQEQRKGIADATESLQEGKRGIAIQNSREVYRTPACHNIHGDLDCPGYSCSLLLHLYNDRRGGFVPGK